MEKIHNMVESKNREFIQIREEKSRKLKKPDPNILLSSLPLLPEACS